MPLTNKNFADLITFTRTGATATRVNSLGQIESVAADTPRFDYDPVTLEAKGLLIEEERTNLLVRSEEFDNAAWVKTNTSATPNAVAAPDGATSADEIVEDSATSGHYVTRTPTVTASETYTGSCFLKSGSGSRFAFLRANNDGANIFAIFNLSTGAVTQEGVSLTSSNIEDFGDGWFRCSITWTTGGDTSSGLIVGLSNSATGGDLPSYAGDGSSSVYAWGAQLEEGAFPTSYIPTAAAAATRAADNASITGTAFSDWFNASEGTVYVEAQPIALEGIVLNMSDGGLNERLHIRAGAAQHLLVVDGGVTQASLDAGTFTAGQASRAAAAFKANDFAACIDSGVVATDGSGTVPTVDRMNVGSSVGANFLNGHIKDIRFYPTRLSNAELQELTA